MKVYLVYRDYHSWECEDALLRVCATEEAAERYIASEIDDEFREDCYIIEEVVFE